MRWLWLAAFVFTASAVVFLAYAPAPGVRQSAPPIVVEPARPQSQPTAAQPAPVARDVGGGAVAPPLDAGVALERIAPPPPPPAEPIVPPDTDDVKPEPTFRLFQPVVVQAGVLVAEGRAITLAGIVPVPPAQRCTGPDGTDWPCGMAARTALRAFVRGRAITCAMDDQTLDSITTQCAIGGTDIAEWLVEQGWAQAAPGTPLARLSDAAKAMGRGIHGGPGQRP